MKKSLLKISLITLLVFNINGTMAFDPFAEPATNIDIEMSDIQIKVSGGNTISIKNAEGMTIEVYSITGEQIVCHKIDSDSKVYEISNLQKGCYIVKVGKITRKVFIK